MASHRDLCIRDASGVWPKAAPAVRQTIHAVREIGKIDAGEDGGSEPPRRLSGGDADTAKGRSVERGDGGADGRAVTSLGTSAGGRAPGDARACEREPGRERGA